MGTVTYMSIDGEILSENRDGVIRDYVPDPLGSTVAMLDATQTKTDEVTYWPYGEVRTRTGTNGTPFLFLGTLGYHTDNSGKSYVRARVLESKKARWLTEDPIGFGGGDTSLYRYADDNPLTVTDPRGTDPLGSAGPIFFPGLIRCLTMGEGHTYDPTPKCLFSGLYACGAARKVLLIFCRYQCVLIRCYTPNCPCDLTGNITDPWHLFGPCPPKGFVGMGGGSTPVGQFGISN